MLPRRKSRPEPASERVRSARTINISALRGEARREMWKKIQAEQPALAADLQSGACARIRAEFPGIAVIVSLDEKNRILTGKVKKRTP